MSFNNYANRDIDYEIILQNMTYANNRDITTSIGNRSVLSPPDQKTVEDYRRRTLPQGVIDPSTGNKTLYRTVHPVAIDTGINADRKKIEVWAEDFNKIINSDNKKHIYHLSVSKDELDRINKKIDDTKILIDDLCSATNIDQLLLLKEKYEKILEKKNNSVRSITTEITQLENLYNEIEQKLNVVLADYNENETKINLLETKNKDLYHRIEINKKRDKGGGWVDTPDFLKPDQLVEAEELYSKREQTLNELKNKNVVNRINSIKLKEENRLNNEELIKLKNEKGILEKESLALTKFLADKSFDYDIDDYDQALEKLTNIMTSLISDREKVNNDIINFQA